MVTPGNSPAAIINATAIASHDTTNPNTRKRGRSGFHAAD
jgi:hypothetical protein